MRTTFCWLATIVALFTEYFYAPSVSLLKNIFTIETVMSYIKQKHTLEKSLILEWS